MIKVPRHQRPASWILIAVAMTAIVWAGCRDESSDTAGQSPAVPSEDQRPPGELFVDAAEASGLDFVHFNGMSGEYYFCEIMCAGAALLDYDNDGDLDVYLIQGKMLGPGKTIEQAMFPPKAPLPLKDRLYRNDLVIDPDGTRTLRFTDVTEASGIEALGYGMGVATGDYDNDGLVDLYVTNFGPNQMFHNNGDGTFTDVTEQTGTDDPRYTTSAAFFDYDRDGWLDLFVCGNLNFSYATHKECFTEAGMLDYCAPFIYEPIPDRLFHNRGDGTFEDVSAKSQIVREYGSGLGVVCADFNGDGWDDIYVANDGRPNLLWINQQDGTFVDDALLGGCAVNRNGNPEGSMGVDAGDFDADGDLDLFMTHITTETNTLYVNDGTGMFEDRVLETHLGMASAPYTAFGTGWFDYDNDGWLDILTVNGAVHTLEDQARAGDPYPFHQRNQLFRNLGQGQFEEVTEKAGTEFARSEVSRGLALGDVDNDGDVDALVTNDNGPVRLLINQVGNRNPWIGLRLVDGRSGSDLLGTRVAVHRPEGPVLWRYVHTAASYLSANDPRVLVGLGKATEVTKVDVHWPDGTVEGWTSLPVNAYTTLRKGSGATTQEVESP